jgi:hypothetical protein
MSNLSKLQFEALDITGKNYLPWALDAEINLAAEGNGDAIRVGNKASDQEKAKALIFIRRHLHEDLKNEYLTVKDPLVLWNKLKERYEHQKTIILPKARYDWIHLRLQDFKTAKDRIHKHFIYGPSINNSEPSDHISTWKHLTRSQVTEFSQRSQLHLARSQLHLCRRDHQHRHRFPHSP